jgi:hypothetical protein
MDETVQEISRALEVLNRRLWENRAPRRVIEQWLDNFEVEQSERPSERLHAQFLLSKFLYFGHREVKALLRTLFKEKYRYHLLEDFRKNLQNSRDVGLFEKYLEYMVNLTRFIGVGNPSESGAHLLYWFRQENELPKEVFIHAHEMLLTDDAGNTQLARSDVKRYVFIDDFCGTGKQVKETLGSLVSQVREVADKAGTSVFMAYYVLVGTVDGLDAVRKDVGFDKVDAVIRLDRSYKCFSPDSRLFRAHPEQIDKTFAQTMCAYYGERIQANGPLGFGDAQLLLGFHHNTPDNTMPIFWCDSEAWQPLFRRYLKLTNNQAAFGGDSNAK